MQTLELQQTADLLRSEQSKTEKLQGFLEHAESDVEQLTNQLEEHKDRIFVLETDKSAVARQLQAAKSGNDHTLVLRSVAHVSRVQRYRKRMLWCRKSSRNQLVSKRSFNGLSRT